MSSFSPQDLLDHLSALDIPALFAADLSADEKNKSIKITKQKLKLLKKEVKEEIDVIKSKWDGRNSYQALQERLNLAPYKMIQNLVLQVEVALNELEIRGSVDWRPDYGSVIVGNMENEEWHIFRPMEATVWHAKNIQSEIKQLQGLIEQDKQTIESLNIEIPNTMRRQSINGISCGVVATIFLLAGFWLVSASSIGAGLLIILCAVGFYLWAFGSLISSRKPSDKLLEQLAGVREHITQCNSLIEERKKALVELKTLYEDLKRQASP